MKKLILLIIFTLCFGEINLTKSEKNFIQTHEIKCAATGNWAPFSIYKNGALDGIAIEYWKKISSKLNIKYTCSVNAKWHEILNDIKLKKKDLTPITDITPQRKSYALFSIPYATFQYVIVTKNDVAFIPSLEFLKNKKIAISKNYTIMEKLKKKYPDLKILTTRSIEESLKKVNNSEAFATLTLLPIAAFYLNDYKFRNLKISGQTPFKFNARVMVRSDYKELLTAINKAIKDLSQKEKNDIYKKWVYRSDFDNEKLFKKILTIGIGVILILSAYIIYQANIIKNKIEENLKLLHFATHDKLTDLANRHILDYNLKQLINEHLRYKKPFSVIFCDIDNFKSINDTRGHKFGDFVLTEIANVIKNSLRKSDIPGRWGGEEFMIILPNTKLEEAVKVAEKIRKKIEKHDFKDTNVTCSFGVSAFNENISDSAFIKNVDKKLYLAKKKGKNRVEY